MYTYDKADDDVGKPFVWNFRAVAFTHVWIEGRRTQTAALGLQTIAQLSERTFLIDRELIHIDNVTGNMYSGKP